MTTNLPRPSWKDYAFLSFTILAIGGLGWATSVLATTRSWEHWENWVGQRPYFELAGGAVGLCIAGVGLWLLNRRTKATEETLAFTKTVETFRKAAEMLGNADCATRLGGVVVLRDLASDYAETHFMKCQDMLAGFLEVQSRVEDKIEKLRPSTNHDLTTVPSTKNKIEDPKPKGTDVDVRQAWWSYSKTRHQREQRVGFSKLPFSSISWCAIANVATRRGSFSKVWIANSAFYSVTFSDTEMQESRWDIHVHNSLALHRCNAVESHFNFYRGYFARVDFADTDLTSATIVDRGNLVTLKDCNVDGLSFHGENLKADGCYFVDRPPKLLDRNFPVFRQLEPVTFFRRTADGDEPVQIAWKRGNPFN